ncbi:hypothetical protein NEHOM01_0628 [Nematocida homosporus]|uniref:uncharacterized protein n=1 Tax=Nematocida homosporus TaxID=1912981 RepID=UPI00221EF078|nr:uncharacterized protein NEHOM01_0628 [Nematocida homosporus]KAI5185123.1 hypothetical protein NEHOM01_0628 [Nematocida homosporus]
MHSPSDSEALSPSSDCTEVLLSPSIDPSVTQQESYYKALILSKVVKAIFCATPLSRVKMPTGKSPFKSHIRTKDIRIKTTSGESLGAWIVYNKKVPITRWVLVLHGNSTNRYTFSTLYDAERLIEHGTAALIVDYRGFGDSEGTASRKAFIEDVAACTKYLYKKKVTNISIVAYSLGTAIALDYLAKYYIKKKDHQVVIAKVVLISPFLSTIQLLQEYRLWNMIESLIPDSSKYAQDALGFNSLESIKQLDLPILIIHGSSDWLIPEHHGRLLSEAGQSTLFLRIENESHSSLFGNPITWPSILQFLLDPNPST